MPFKPDSRRDLVFFSITSQECLSDGDGPDKDRREIRSHQLAAFPEWLARMGASLAFTTYQAGKVFFVGTKADGRLSVFERTFARCMGLGGISSGKGLRQLNAVHLASPARSAAHERRVGRTRLSVRTAVFTRSYRASSR